MGKPENKATASSMIEAGASDSASVLVSDPMSRKSIDIDNVVQKLIRKKKKNGPGSRRRLHMKYSRVFIMTLLTTLYGRSKTADASASALGWYSA